MTTVEKLRDALDRPDLSTGSGSVRSSLPAGAQATIVAAAPPAAASPAPREAGPAQPALTPAPGAAPQAAPMRIETVSAEPPTTGTLAGPPSPAAPPSDASPAAASSDPSQCPSPKLQAVLADVAERFGPVSVVAGHQLTTANHLPGSSRERLHHDCLALDFRPERSRIDEIKAYLRSRPEIGGVDSYRDGVVHMDLGGSALAGRRAPALAARKPAPPSAAAPMQRTVNSEAPLMRDDR